MTKTNFNGTTIKRQSCYSNSRQDTYPKGQNQDDKGKQQFKDNQHSQTEHQPNTQNQNNDQDSSDKKQHPSDQTQDSSSKGTQPKQSQSIEDRDKTVKQPSSKKYTK